MSSVYHSGRFSITLEKRASLMGQSPCVVWFTGLSGAGKTTLATFLESLLIEKGYKAYVLDGDSVRAGLNNDLSFTIEDRNENMRRIGEVAKLMVDAGLIVISAFISPLKEGRELIRKKIGEHRFVEVYLECPIEICEKRDVKGLYEKARKGEIKNFTGIDSPYEKPESPNLIIYSGVETVEESAKKIVDYLIPHIKLLNESR